MKIRNKEELEALGITVEGLDVYRNGKLLKEQIRSKTSKNSGHTCSYIGYTIGGYKKQRWVNKSNIIYCWYIGDRDISKDIDHINNNSLDDRPENLQLLTRKENLAKREGFKIYNQYTTI
jgi:5-methylcytosine-specific restriction endonuclease McrA